MTPTRSDCEAPTCTRPAEYLAVGDDLDGTHFEDRVCGSCASYLMECGADVRPLSDSDSWELNPS
jgi:hypothetical protein